MGSPTVIRHCVLDDGFMAIVTTVLNQFTGKYEAFLQIYKSNGVNDNLELIDSEIWGTENDACLAWGRWVQEHKT